MKASQLRELIRELIKTHLDEMSTTGALVQPGGQQIATTKAFSRSMRDWKKANKDKKWESINEGTSIKKGDYVLFKGSGSQWTKSKVMQVIPSVRKLHIMWNDEYTEVDVKDVKPIESVNESYRGFKKDITNPRQQMNNSVREIERHLRSVAKIVEYNLKLKTEMDLGGGNFYEGTNKRLARISEIINHLNNKLNELGN